MDHSRYLKSKDMKYLSALLWRYDLIDDFILQIDRMVFGVFPAVSSVHFP